MSSNSASSEGEDFNDTDGDDSSSETESVQEETEINFVAEDKEKAFLKFHPQFEDVTHEFADVEIFLISVDSLLIELTAHNYHNWTFGGQTVVLIEQLERFLSLLADRGGKFKLTWFTQLLPLYEEDAELNFLRSVVAWHFQHKAKWLNDVVVFKSPMDPAWHDFLGHLTPSFLLISADDPSTPPFKEFNGAFARRFSSIMFDALEQNIPVVELVGMTINVANVSAVRIGPKPISFHLLDEYIKQTWSSGGYGDGHPRQMQVLPVDLQEQLVALHKIVGLSELPILDVEDQLLQGRPPIAGISLLSSLKLAPVKASLLRQFAPEVADLMAHDGVWEGDANVKRFIDAYHWHNQRRIDDGYGTEKPTDSRTAYHRNRDKQLLSRWYERFAQSLEGQKSSLLVDFARSRRMQTVASGGNHAKSKSNEATMQKPMKKKDAIIQNNIAAKARERIADELSMIGEALKQDNCIISLEALIGKLKFPQSKARCFYEMVKVRKMKLLEAFGKAFSIKQCRFDAMNLVGYIKDLFKDEFWSHLDDKQRASVNKLWHNLGFDAPLKATRTMTLGMNMIDYQLAVAGQLIDIQLNPQHDPRVTGFEPDEWQRKLLDVVDQKNSALIIAPTSAGKTFVSYYCIEQVLRESDDDVVIYVSPTKALVNQVAGSIYARFRNKRLENGRSLFGVFTRDFRENVTTCQVLITVPQCLEILLMSATPGTQEWCERIKYVIFDEVHCIGARGSTEMDTGAVVWEHVLLMIRCPFLALSATIGNASALHEWLLAAEKSKNSSRTVKLITYDERWSELEMAVQCLNQASSDKKSAIAELNPFSVYVPDKLRMFGIPADQQLTARQVFDLFTAMADVDESVKTDLLPATFFDLQAKDDKFMNKVWLTRKQLREYEAALKQRFMEWLNTGDVKVTAVLRKLGVNVRSDLDARSKTFDQRIIALKNIVPLIDDLRRKKLLPALCFSDDRRMCELLASRLGEELKEREQALRDSAEFKEMFGQQMKDAEKKKRELQRLRDAAEKEKQRPRKKGEKREDMEERDNRPVEEPPDPVAVVEQRIVHHLAQFRLGKRGVDEDLFNWVIDRLRYKGGNNASTRRMIELLERGIGYHHSGLPTVQRQSVEILFRSGHLAVVFSTSTLALGINMPCKTVIFSIDSQYLTPLQFRQMCGRAGRRGFDQSGQVVFLGLPTGKIRRLLTASLGSLRGSIPFTTSFVLRLLTLVAVDDQPIDGVVQRKKPVRKFGQLTTDSALTLLRNAFVKYTGNADRADDLDRQLRFYFGFATQLLRQMSLIDQRGAPTGFAGVINHVHYHEPGNLVFVYLLQNGAFHRLCQQYRGSQLKSKMVLILAHLFTNVRLPRYFARGTKKFHNSMVFMDPLPSEFEQLIKTYNDQIRALFAAFLQQMCDGQSLQGETFSLAGRQDCQIDLMAGDIIMPLNKAVTFDQSLLPSFAYPPTDHRGGKCLMNAYACDFYLHSIKQALMHDNGLKEGDVYHLVNDFQLTLMSIANALSVVGDPNDVVVTTMNQLAKDYQCKFNKAFPRFKNG